MRLENGPWHVYVLCEEDAGDIGPCKIGTAGNLKYRIDGMRSGNWRKLVVIRSWVVRSRHEALSLERSAHKILAKHRFPARDWFKCEPSIVINLVDSLLERVQA